MKQHLLLLSAIIIAIVGMVSCTGNVKDVEVGPYTVSVIEKNVYHIQDYNTSNPAGGQQDPLQQLLGHVPHSRKEQGTSY